MTQFLNEFISNGHVCRTSPGTLGLLNIVYYNILYDTLLYMTVLSYTILGDTSQA